MRRDLVNAALRQYALTEPTIRAWVEVNPQEPLEDGPLNGIPFGVKDIFETAGMATEYGSALYSGRKGSSDATIVIALRRCGAVLFGKTQTTAFAYFDSAPTRNPLNPAHTPGGSSSGSAAAVGAGVVPFALGTQTMGSILRPASYCGVVGFKPTFGLLPCDGVLPFAPSLDTVGLLTESVGVCKTVCSALGIEEASNEPLRFGIPGELPDVSPEMQATFTDAVRILRTHFVVDPVELAVRYQHLLTAAKTVNDYEGARSHQEHLRQFGDRIGAKLSELVIRGMQISKPEYEEKLRLIQAAASAMDDRLGDALILLTPAALGVAPHGLGSTGDPMMNAVWTALGTPAISIPMPRRSGDLPLGIQMIARRGADGSLLKAAALVERLFTT